MGIQLLLSPKSRSKSMAISWLLSLSLAFSLLSLASPTKTALPLSHSHKPPGSDPWQRLNHLASASLTRAHHLKYPHNRSLIKTPLFPHSYGDYSVSLSFGTPPQTLPFIMDTGSSLTWFPCTKRYVCNECYFSKTDPTKIASFVPKESSSSKILGCKNPKCGWVIDSDVKSRCQDSKSSSGNCTETCPNYVIQYGSGATVGYLLLENLYFPEKIVPDFLVGCSIFTTSQPSGTGIAGFGQGPMSLPAQMGLKKFSYCLLSHQYDDTPESSDLVLDSGSDSGHGKTPGVSYTPFGKNPVTNNSAYMVYYYVTLRKIIVGNKSIKIPYKFLVPGSNGHGGTIVDSGTTITFMEKQVFEPVAREFETQMANYTRATDIETLSGLRPCFDVSGKKSVAFPDLVFGFKGGAKIALPLKNYFSFFANSGVVCLTLVTSEFAGGDDPNGPSIILGNIQQQGFYMEYDLENERLGFRKQSCKK